MTTMTQNAAMNMTLVVGYRSPYRYKIPRGLILRRKVAQFLKKQ